MKWKPFNPRGPQEVTRQKVEKEEAGSRRTTFMFAVQMEIPAHIQYNRRRDKAGTLQYGVEKRIVFYNKNNSNLGLSWQATPGDGTKIN